MKFFAESHGQYQLCFVLQKSEKNPGTIINQAVSKVLGYSFWIFFNVRSNSQYKPFK